MIKLLNSKKELKVLIRKSDNGVSMITLKTK